MDGHLERNTVQKVRQFLDTLDVRPAPYATSQEVVDLLVERVRERRDQIAFRHDLQALIRSLDSSAGSLPAPGCETRSPDALAAELARLLEDGELGDGISPAVRGAVGALAAAMLWMAASASTGCDPVGACLEDVSVENFEAIADSGWAVTACEADEYTDQFRWLPQREQADVIGDLCQMSPHEITAYLEDNFVAPNCSGDDDDEPWLDDDDTYKGVSF